MFAPKNFNLPNKLVEASRKIMEQKQETQETYELSEEDEQLFEEFEAFLEENFYVDELTEEELNYLFDMYFAEADEEPKSGSMGSAFKSLGKLVGIGGGSSETQSAPRQQSAPSTQSAPKPKTPTEIKQQAPAGGLSGIPGSEDYITGGRPQGTPPLPGSPADAARKTTQQARPQARPQAPSMSSKKSSSSGGDVIGRTGTSYGKGGEWKRAAMEPNSGG
jgi:hypothetical protein